MARFITNAMVSSLLAFYFSFLITLLGRYFIKSKRVLFYFSLLPLFKVFCEMLFSSHSHWIYHYGEIIRNGIPNSRTLSIFLGYQGLPFMEMKFEVKNLYTFSLGDICFELGGRWLILSVGFLYLLVTLYCIIRKIISWYKTRKWIQTLLSQSSFYQHKKGIPIYQTTKSIHSPLILGIFKPKVIFPENLLEIYTEDEYQAILSHEFVHIQYKDNLCSALVFWIESLFWFIPLHKKILKDANFYRELSCDQNCDTLSIITALNKTQTADLKAPFAIAFSPNTMKLSKRIEFLIFTKNHSKSWLVASWIFSIGMTAFVLGSSFFPF